MINIHNMYEQGTKHLFCIGSRIGKTCVLLLVNTTGPDQHAHRHSHLSTFVNEIISKATNEDSDEHTISCSELAHKKEGCR